MAILTPTTTAAALESPFPADLSTVLDEFTRAWKNGERRAAEDYIDRLDPYDSRAAVELIFREFCLLGASGSGPDHSQYLERFPRHKTALERLFQLHDACPPSLLDRWMETTPALDVLPRAGDSIGPYVLRRELGRGGFARVFLAEQTTLENRLVVLKVSTRMSREPWLLARVRHPHIVEIVSHAEVDDGALHLICMPFWGGASLAAVLGERERKQCPPATGNDLLADLDAVAAPEFPTVAAARPARELLAGLTYAQTVAWVGARLAEALDYAFSRDVAHGDVKPSNILLSADGVPLLFDFNLAREHARGGPRDAVNERGGTLAYMAPERLRAVARRQAILGGSWPIDPPAEPSSGPHSIIPPGLPDAPARTDQDFGPHQADIYSLGIVLLEALTGQRGVSTTASRAPLPAAIDGRADASADVYALLRARAAPITIRESESRGWGTISPGLRAILERCLDPDPGARYQRGLQLAEDLDRWRADRPLVYAAEPFWGQTVPRLVRRQRKTILTALILLGVILATTTIVLLRSQQTLQVLGSHKLGRMWDDPEARAFGFQRFPGLLERDDSRVQTANRALTAYDVLGPVDWRGREDVQALSRADREDLEVWLLEQAYVFCRALADRPNSPDDWRRGLKILDRVSGPAPLSAFASLRRRLSAGTPAAGPGGPPAEVGPSGPPGLSSWADEYLLGILAENEPELLDRGLARTAGARPDGVSSRSAVVLRALDRNRLAGERALEHYNNFLANHPDSFWAHYRAAAAAYGLGGSARLAEAADHLEQCLKRRPNNPAIHHHRAVCLIGLDQYREAQREIEIAIDEAPDLAEFYRTRATLRAKLKQSDGLAGDLRHFELLSHLLPRAFWGGPLALAHETAGQATAPSVGFPASIDPAPRVRDRAYEPGAEGSTVPASIEELEARASLATTIREAGERDLAAAELGKILLLEPDHIGVRMTRAIQALEAGRLDDAWPDLQTVMAHPGLAAYLREEPLIFKRLHEPSHRSLLCLLRDASRYYCRNGRLEEGRAIARRALDLDIELDQPRGMSHFNLARACAESARSDPTSPYVEEAANHLFRAFVAHPGYQAKYKHESTFDAVRVWIDASLNLKADSRELHQRKLAVRSPLKGR